MKKQRKPSPTEERLPEIHEQFVKLIEEGYKRVACCRTAGIDYHTFLKWLELGETEGNKFSNFSNDIKKAESEHEHDMIGLAENSIEAAIKKGIWQAGARYLESIHPAKWSRKTELSGNVKILPASHGIGSTDTTNKAATVGIK